MIAPSKLISSKSIQEAEKFLEKLTGDKELIVVDESKASKKSDDQHDPMNHESKADKSEDSDSDDGKIFT
jgi:hypothetical protein